MEGVPRTPANLSGHLSTVNTAVQKQGRVYMKREFNQDVFGDEGYYTACSLLVIMKNSCGKLHYQIVSN